MADRPCGYGRYASDPEYVGCPRAASDMTPCVARDGHPALTDDTNTATCMGCGQDPHALLVQLDEATGATAAEDMRVTYPSVLARASADHLRGRVREVTGG